ncbi:MAG: DUF7684 family protein [Gammaproteobacteria bacterium]
MNKGCKVVLISISGYKEEHNDLLQELIENEIELFSAVGIECQEWEEAMGFVCAELDANDIKPNAFCNTTSHPDESVEDVIKFAESWSQNRTAEVKIIEI